MVDDATWAVANRRIREATDKAARLEQENVRLRDLVHVLTDYNSDTEALWKRIANQRRELKWAYHYMELYCRLYWDKSNG